MENKRGQAVTLAVVAFVVIIALGIVLSFAFSEKLRFTIIGGGVMLGSFILFGKAIQSGKTNRQITGFSILVFGVGLVLILIPFFGFFTQTQLGGGFTVLSISHDIDVSSPNPELDGKFFLVNVIGDSGAERIIGTVSTTEFASKSGVATEKPLKIEITSIDETIDYPIINDRVPIYQYLIQRNNDPIFGSPDNCPSDTIKEINLIGTDLYCVRRQQIGVKGSMENPNIKNEAEIKLTVGSETITELVSNHDTSVIFRDSNGVLRATVNSVGLLVTGDSAPNQDNFVPTYFDNTVAWNLAKEFKWEEYNTKAAAFETSVLNVNEGATRIIFPTVPGILLGLTDFSFGSDAEIESALNQMISSVRSAQIDLIVANDILIPGQDIVNSGSKENSKVRGSLDRRLTSQNLLFKVQALWLGVDIQSGKPNIIKSSLKCETFKSGDPGFIEGRIRNAGDGVGTFEFTVNDCDPFKAKFSGATNRITLNPGVTADFSVALTTGSGAEDITETCSITAKDIGFPDSKDTETVICSLEEPASCTAGEQDRVGLCIFECREDESGKDEVICCEETPQKDATTGNFVCGEDIDIIIEDGNGGTSGGDGAGDGTTTSTPQAECEAKAEDNRFAGYTYIEKETESCGLNPLCHAGVTKPKVTTESSCEARFIPLYIIGGVLLILTIFALFLIFGKKKKAPRRRRRRK